MVIDRLAPTQWRTALALRVAALTESPEAFGSTVARERGLPQATWEARLGDNAWFAAYDAEAPVGLVSGIHTESARERELTSLWVAPGHRGAGVGDALVLAVREWALDGGAERLRLVVVRSNRSAIDLYTRHGFELAPTTRAELRPSDVLMSLALTRSA